MAKLVDDLNQLRNEYFKKFEMIMAIEKLLRKEASEGACFTVVSPDKLDNYLQYERSKIRVKFNDQRDEIVKHFTDQGLAVEATSEGKITFSW